MEFRSRFFRLPKKSFFLFGLWGTGKSTWLRHELPDAVFVDLLKPEVYRELQARPERLREIAKGSTRNRTVVVDEVQRVPELLSVVHEVLEPPGSPRYVLTGSSARKLRRGGANLLAGRALLRTLHPFMAAELAEFRIEDALRFGLLPLVVGAEDPEDALRSYAALYLEQEVQLEGWAWNIGNFARFMESISMSHGAVLNVSNVARECQIERKTAAGYVEVIEDLLLGFRLPEDKQQILMQRLEEGRADTYNKLRALVDSLLIAQGEQTAIGPEMSADHKAVGERYDRMIERLAGFIRFSFNPDDLKILPRVVTSSLDVNIQRLDLIAAELHKIKKALIQAQAARDAAGKEAA